MDTPITSSQESICDVSLPKMDYGLSQSEQLIAVLTKEIKSLKDEVRDLKIDKISHDLSLDRAVVALSPDVGSKKSFTKRGRGFRPILEHEIREAYEKGKSARASARFLGVSYRTFKKYAEMYGIFVTRRNIKGVTGRCDPEKGPYPLSRILNGEFPKYSVFLLKDKLIRSGAKKAECEICGYCEKRLTDGKVPLLLNFEDGNSENHKIENLKILCYNCTFNAGRGYICGKRKTFDPDRLQGSKYELENTF